MPNLIIMCGLPFSGKTYLAKKISIAGNYNYISFDEIWQTKNKELDKWLSWEQITKIAKTEITNLINNGKTVIYDDLNDTLESRENLKELANKLEAKYIVIYLNTSEKTRWKRYEENKISLERHDISHLRFKESKNKFDYPHKIEGAISYNEGDDIDKWIDALISAQSLD